MISAGFILAVGSARADQDNTGQIVFMKARPAPGPPAATSPAHAASLMSMAEALRAEVADLNTPIELRAAMLGRVGEMIGRAWAFSVPDPEVEISPVLRLLVQKSGGRGSMARTAEGGLRRVVDALAAHARNP